MGAICQSSKNTSEDKSPEKEIPKKQEIKPKEVTNEDDIVINNQILIGKARGTPLEKYEIIKTCGEGSYGKVYLVRHKELKVQRAMKEIQKHHDYKEEDIQNEINILKKLDHPNIVKIYEFFSVKDKYFLIVEYCREGELFEQLKSVKVLSEPHAAFLSFQVLQAVAFCHSNNVIHRDLKLENILVEGREKNGYFTVKVSDFGTAAAFNKNSDLNKVIGSCYYIAPEVIKKKYNEKCDLWSLGCVIYVLLSGTLPFMGKNDIETMELIQHTPLNFSEKWDTISEEARTFIAKLLNREVSKRPSAEQALQDPWFLKFNIKEKTSNVNPQRLNQFVDNLKSYKSNYKLQQAAIAVIIHNMPRNEDIKEMEKAFRSIDENGDGRINKDELKKNFSIFFENKPNIKQEVEEIFKNVDADQNGYIEYEEFIGACIDKAKLVNDEFLKMAFNFFDIDGSGTITMKELKAVFCGGGDVEVSNKVIENIIGKVDGNNDGKISFEEFKTLMRGILSMKNK